jgi:hypothetical protein
VLCLRFSVLQVLSTRIYRGQAPEGTPDAGISFIAFGGTAEVQHCCTWEMGSAWQQQADVAAAAAAKLAASPKRAARASAQGSRQGSPARSPPPPMAGRAKGSPGSRRHSEGNPAAAAAAAMAAAAAADALLDDLVMCVSPHCSSPIMAGAFATS